MGRSRSEGFAYLGSWPSFRSENLVLFQECTGAPLDEVVDHQGSLDGVRDAARWLAELHLSSVQLPRTFDTLREVASTHAWAAAVGRHSPQLLKPAQRLASLWATIGPPRHRVRRCRSTRISMPGT